MKFLCLLLIFLTLFVSCYSTPQVSKAIEMEEGKYDVKINANYVEIPKEFQYAINSFVIKQGGTSYDVEMEKRGQINYIYVTIPGSTEIDPSMPRVRHFHRGKTIIAITVPIGGAALLAGYLFLALYPMVLFVSFWGSS